MRIKILVGALVFGLSNMAFAQIGLKPLNSNPTLQAFKKHHPDYVWNTPKRHAKWGKPDTLNLPFFEDFVSTLIYPDSSKWQDNQVFVNRDFGIHPPSYGVATFDFLDENGLPYSSLEKEFIAPGDTLTSEYIDLGGGQYSASDSIYLSFFFQARGRGDFSTAEDSFKIQFRDTAGHWLNMWGVSGGKNYTFSQIMLPVTSSAYLHDGFQFRFVNITHRWGNNNHWHLDYILVDEGRTITDIYHPDYAIQSRPSSLLKHYYSMPYEHFEEDVSEAADTVFFFASNLRNDTINAEIRHIERNNGNVLVSTNFEDNAGDIRTFDYAERKVIGYDFTGLNGYPVEINRSFYIKPAKGATNAPPYIGNDSIRFSQTFTRHFAYDDGTAESGFGFNDLRNDTGWIVVAFDLKKADSLHAVDILITYNTKDIARQRFEFQIYKDIAINGGSDELVYEQTFLVGDIYEAVDNRGFYTIRLDEGIELQPGKFYVGWRQEKNYNLTLGWDKNNGYIYDANSMNQNIYFNIGDGWVQNNNEKLIGAPMIRPIVGAKHPWASVSDVNRLTYQVYPNPTDGILHVPANTMQVEVSNTAGSTVLIQERPHNAQIDVESLKPGLYFIQMKNDQNQIINSKFIKQ